MVSGTQQRSSTDVDEPQIALETAHRTGVLHRDITPDNVLLSRSGEPVLADFGIARMAGQPRTRTGVVTATVAHAPPEVLDGRPPTRRSDVYSLGSTLYALLAGHAPFVVAGDPSVSRLMTRVFSEPPADLRGRGVPGDLCALLERSLAKDPADRPRSALEFGRAVQELQRRRGEDVTGMVVEQPPPGSAGSVATPRAGGRPPAAGRARPGGRAERPTVRRPGPAAFDPPAAPGQPSAGAVRPPLHPPVPVRPGVPAGLPWPAAGGGSRVSTGLVVGVVVVVLALLAAGGAGYFVLGPGRVDPVVATPAPAGPPPDAPGAGRPGPPTDRSTPTPSPTSTPPRIALPPPPPGAKPGLPRADPGVQTVVIDVGDCVEIDASQQIPRAAPVECGSAAAEYKVIAKAPNSAGCPSDANASYFETRSGVEVAALCLDVDWVRADCFDLSGEHPRRVDCTASGPDVRQVREILSGTADPAGCTAVVGAAGFAFPYPERNVLVCLTAV